MFQTLTYRFADPIFMQNSFHSSQWPPNGSNYGFYKNDRVDMLLDQGPGEADAAKRTAIYQQAQQLLVDDPPVVFIFTTNYLFGARKLKDVHFPANQQLSFSGISKA